MKVTHIVNQETKSKGFLLISPVNSARDVPVHEIVFIVTGFTQPIVDVLDGLNNTIGVILKVRIVIEAAPLVQVRSVNEMPVVLPLLPSLLDLISEGGALNEWIATL